MFRNQNCILVFLVLCILFCAKPIKVFAGENGEMDTAIRNKRVLILFTTVDTYMDQEQYDSAHIYLNNISKFFSLNEPVVLNYYLYSRRAEVDYYNGLSQLGITNAKRALVIAKQLNDKILMQDAYNFLGLLYVGIDSLSTAKRYFFKSIQTIVLPPYPNKYLFQTMPYHIYGNLSEVYEKENLFDSAFFYSKISLKKALASKQDRGIAMAYNSMARAFFNKNQRDSALHYYGLSTLKAFRAKLFDIQLLNQEGIASLQKSWGSEKMANESLNLGISILEENPLINTYFKREFLRSAIKLYGELNNQKQLFKVTNILLKVEEETNRRHFNQMEFILANSIKNEANIIKINLEQEKKSKQLQINQLYIVILVLVLLAIVLVFYQYSAKEKLKLSILKNKISQDLHDDVGASLSSINMSAALAEKLIGSNPDKARMILNEISSNAENGISTLSDIVWAMKPQSDNSTTFESKVKNYAYNLLSIKDIECSYDIDKGFETKLSNIEIRKNLLLLIKEAFNNIAKHSNAHKVMVKLSLEPKNCIKLTIRDDGIGFKKSEIKYGNGIQNMDKRVADCKGSFSIESDSEKGTIIEVFINF